MNNLSDADFKDYYENKHAPLASSLLTLEGYERNYVNSELNPPNSFSKQEPPPGRTMVSDDESSVDRDDDSNSSLLMPEGAILLRELMGFTLDF